MTNFFSFCFFLISILISNSSNLIPGFDYENLPDPTAPENIEKPHGRGVFLMRHLADDCAFEDAGRVVELTFSNVFA